MDILHSLYSSQPEVRWSGMQKAKGRKNIPAGAGEHQGHIGKMQPQFLFAQTQQAMREPQLAQGICRDFRKHTKI